MDVLEGKDREIYDAFVGMLSITADIHFDIGVVYQRDNLVYRPKVTWADKKIPMPQPLQYVTGPLARTHTIPRIWVR